MTSSLGHQTVASLLKSKPPVPYANMLRQVTNHIKKLQEELSAESSTNIEFEESSRRSFEFLTSQLKALKQAFNTLSDTLLEELEHISHTVVVVGTGLGVGTTGERAFSECGGRGVIVSGYEKMIPVPYFF